MKKTIDIDDWPRKEHFEHYFKNIPCTYSMTTKVDITTIVNKKQKLYPTMLYLLTKLVNRHEEFRTSVNEQNQPFLYENMHPSYTVFHQDSETFSCLWTSYNEDYQTFCQSYQQDIEQYGHLKSMTPKPQMPENVFNISMIPWASFEGFNLNLQKGYDYLLPIFTMGKYYEENGKYFLPLAIQVHHAVCDGFHVCRFVNELQELINQ